MLIYNFQKEFLGVDEKDLRILGFRTLEELRAEVTDFADLFVKTPGYIHNFKHIHWIDFIQYSDESEEAKVIININAKTFGATVKLSTLFLIDNPSTPAYIVHLQNLRQLTKSEINNLSAEVLERELPKVEPQEPRVLVNSNNRSTIPPVAPLESIKTPLDESYDTIQKDIETPIYETPKVTTTPLESIQASHDIPLEIDFDEAEEIPPVPKKEETPLKTQTEDMISLSEISLDVFADENEEIPDQNKLHEEKIEIAQEPDVIMQEADEITQEADMMSEEEDLYEYDPNIASKELGLPIDLIEEFIQDFIMQAKDFREEIYTAIQQDDVEKVKMLSHKLKGVAANLRVEDAHEVLSTVSASSEMNIIHDSLDTFYRIIAKLSGEPQEIPKPKKVLPQEKNIQETETIDIEFKDEDKAIQDKPAIKHEVPTEEKKNEELIQIDFKDDEADTPLEIKDEDVPDKIEILELADDDFFEDMENNVQTQQTTETETFSYSKIKAAAEIGLDQESFNELFEDFVEESHTIFQNIINAMNNNDFENSRNEAVKFKGMSDNMRLHEFNNELETLIYSSDKESIIQAAHKIDTAITKISQEGA